MAEYDRREAILARHGVYVVYREAGASFQLRTDGRPGTRAPDPRAAYVCDARGVPVTFGQASYAIEYAWEHLLPPEARESMGTESGSVQNDGHGAAASGASGVSGFGSDGRRHGVEPGG